MLCKFELMNKVKLNYELEYGLVWHNPQLYRRKRMELCLFAHEDLDGNCLFDYLNFQDSKYHNCPYPILVEGYLIGLN